MNIVELASPTPGRHSVRVTRRLGAAILAALSLGLLVQVPTAGVAWSAGSAAAGPAQTTITTDYFESRLLARTNARRAAHGCRALRSNSALTTAARRHSSMMSYQGNLSHRLAGEADLAARDVAAGYTPWRMLAENLAWGQPTPGAVFRAWVNSPLHRANLDNCRLRDVGFGVVIRDGRPWVTADFGRHY